jgi:hypothetical protein
LREFNFIRYKFKISLSSGEVITSTNICFKNFHSRQHLMKYKENSIIPGRIQKFPDWPPGAGTANGTALCH